MTKAKSGFGVDQEGSTARTEAPASNQIAQGEDVGTEYDLRDVCWGFVALLTVATAPLWYPIYCVGGTLAVLGRSFRTRVWEGSE